MTRDLIELLECAGCATSILKRSDYKRLPEDIRDRLTKIRQELSLLHDSIATRLENA